MSKFSISLNAHVKEFSEKFNLKNKDEDNIFENFSNYIVISHTLEKEFEEINKVETKKAQGIDGVGIIINNRLISDVSDLDKIGENEKIKLSIVFIQATTQNSFEESKMSAFIDDVISFLIYDHEIEPFTSILKAVLEGETITEEEESKNFLDKLIETPKVFIYYLSAVTKHDLKESDKESLLKKAKERSDINSKFDFPSLEFWQSDDITEKFREISSFHEVLISFYKHFQLEEKDCVPISLLALIKFQELKKIIISKDDYLKEFLFVENPRLSLGNTKVNEDIKESAINEEYNQYFAYLNNGLTILCNTITRHSTIENKFTLKHPRIINGCQTTHMLYELFKDNSEESLGNIELIVKVIATEENDLKKKIIFAANNQNAIDKDLQSMDDVHEKIERYFLGNDTPKIYYERLRGQYSRMENPYSKISIENLAKIYISVFLEQPHVIKSRAIKIIEEYKKDKKIFDDDSSIPQYYYCGLLYYWLNKFFLNNNLKLKSKSQDMHLLLAIDKFLNNNYVEEEKKIEYLKKEENAKDIFLYANNFIESCDYLFGRKGFYSGKHTRWLLENIGENEQQERDKNES